VIPVLLHHSESGWTARTTVQELYHPVFTSNPIFAPYIPHLSFVLDDIGHISNEALRQRAWRNLPALTVLVLRDGRSPERLIDAWSYWGPDFDGLAPDLRAMLLILSYIEQVAPDHLDRILNAIEAHAPSTKETLMTFSEVIVERARTKALAEGELKGELKGRLATLLQLLNLKFGDISPDVRERVATASELEITRWAGAILTAMTIEDVFKP
jgi:hypothetical protein